MTKKEKQHILLAINEARRHLHDSRYHLCAIIASGNKIISMGFNQLKTHPKATNPYRYLHAEIDAIIGMPIEELKGATMYVARVGYTSRERICMSKPCKYCAAAIKAAGIKKVYYTYNSNAKIGCWDIRNDHNYPILEEVHPED